MTLRRRRDACRRAGVEAITTAVLVLRRRADAGHRCFAVTQLCLPELLGEACTGLCAAQDRLTRLADPALLDARPRRAAGLRVEDHTKPGAGERFILECETALGAGRTVERALAAVVLGLDGECSLGEALGARDARLLAAIRTPVALGYLEFEGGP